MPWGAKYLPMSIYKARWVTYMKSGSRPNTTNGLLTVSTSLFAFRKAPQHEQIDAHRHERENHAGRILDHVQEVDPGIPGARTDVAEAICITDDDK